MIFYKKTVGEFLNAVRNGINLYLNEMENGAQECNMSAVAQREMNSWENNAEALASLLTKSKIPNEVFIGFEYLF